jgi:hypothetical protein
MEPFPREMLSVVVRALSAIGAPLNASIANVVVIMAIPSDAAMTTIR